MFEPWKDPASTGQAYSRELEELRASPDAVGRPGASSASLVAVVAAVLVWWAFRSTRWGFRLQVLGGNPEAARRAGMSGRAGSSSAAFAAGGAAGRARRDGRQVAGVEGRLRPDLLVGFGFIGFLASWLGRHHPLKVVVAAVLLWRPSPSAAAGSKITAGLSGGAVNVLMALVLLAVLGWGSNARDGSR